MTDEPLEARIASALSDTEVTWAMLAKLIVETEAAITAADKDAEQARMRALDPALSPDPKAARAAMEDAAFTRDRLRTVLPRLQQRHAKVQRAEAKAAWVAQFDELVPHIDAPAEELRDTYCEFAPRMVDILTRARARCRGQARSQCAAPARMRRTGGRPPPLRGGACGTRLYQSRPRRPPPGS